MRIVKLIDDSLSIVYRVWIIGYGLSFIKIEFKGEQKS